MKKLIWFTTVSILFLVFVVPAILALGIKLIPGEDQPGYDPNFRLSIYWPRVVKQQFVSKDSNLSAIATSIRNPNLKNKEEIVFTLFDSEMHKIRETIINGENVEDGNFTKFYFDTIPDSKDKTYFFTLSSLNAGPEETIEVFYSDNMPDWIVQFTYDENEKKGGLPIVLYYKPESSVVVIKDIYSSLFSRLLFPNYQKP